jgi:hypothetical protein
VNVIPWITRKNTSGHQESCKLILSFVKHDRGRLISSLIRPTESAVKIKGHMFLAVKI